MKLQNPTFSLLLLIFSALPVFAQQPNATPPVAEQDDAIKISTNLIQLDATVTDKSGIAVTDLTTGDFEILQDGKPQRIVNLAYVKPSRTKPAPNNREPRLSQPIPTNVRAPQGRIITFVIDDGNCVATPEGISSAQKTIFGFINERMLPDDKVAIYRTRGGSSLLQIYTSDRNILKRTVEQVKWFPSGCGSSFNSADNSSTARHLYGSHGTDTWNEQQPPGNQSSFERESSKELRQSAEADARAAQSAGTLGVLGFVVDRLKSLPQRKLVFLLSEGISGGQNLETFQEISDKAGRAGVVIYSITGKTMTSTGMFEARDDASLDPTNKATESIRDGRINEERSLNSGLSFLAEMTGGKFIRGKAAPETEIERILDAATGYYLLGYEPEDDTFKGKQFHKIEVRLKNRPGLEVAARRGFYGALVKEDDKKNKTKPRGGETALYEALVSPIVENEIGLRMTTLFENKESRLRALFHVKGKDLTLVEDSDAMKKIVLETVGLIFDEAGNVVDEFNQTYPIRIPKTGVQTVIENGLEFSRDFKIKKPGVYSVRFVIRDSGSKRLGTAAGFVEAPDLKKGNFFISNLVTTEITKNGKPLVSKSRPNETPFAPVFFQSIPSIRRYYRGTAMAYTYSIANAKLFEASKKPQLTVQVKLYKNGKVLTELKEKPVDIEPPSDPANIQGYGFLKLNETITAGEYVLQLIVKDTLANKTASQWIDFEIVQ